MSPPIPDVVYEKEGYTSIPDTPLYIVARKDSWTGLPLTGDRLVIDVFACDSHEQADAVARYAKVPLIRMGDVTIVEEPPPYLRRARMNARSVTGLLNENGVSGSSTSETSHRLDRAGGRPRLALRHRNQKCVIHGEYVSPYRQRRLSESNG